jgi:hypothetical protein
MSNYSAITSSELQKLSHKDQVRFALFCAKSVSHLSSHHEIQLTIKTVELWLDNKATTEECNSAAYAAYAAAAYADVAYAAAVYAVHAAGYAAGYAGYAAAYAAANAAVYAGDAVYAAGYAANDANDLRRQQREYYNELLYIDKIFEKIVLGCK